MASFLPGCQFLSIVRNHRISTKRCEVIQGRAAMAGAGLVGPVSGSDNVMSCRRLRVARGKMESRVINQSSRASAQCCRGCAGSSTALFVSRGWRRSWLDARRMERTRLRGVGGRWSVGTVTVSSWSCHQLCCCGAGGKGQGGRGAGLRDWRGQLGVAAIVASDQCTIKAQVRMQMRAWDKKTLERRPWWRRSRQVSKGSVLVEHFETTRVHRWAEGAVGVGSRLGAGWRARSTKPPSRRMVDNFQAGLLSRHWKFGHVENGELWKRRAHESQVDKRLLS
ncbi:hypothetical protein B0T18DRAFT_31933 [Schizothecium vesticola]|uniref:Uncharacterized protein n=1 Tax=Schizothecium vesticola TaxID=314040 RepID=A0AA40KCI2_9PEZI|nr:hypothetical protein B0T18DRAFT_31933 [Schizothecium vesticola]